MSERSNKPGPISWVLTERDLSRMLELIRTSSEVVLDLETTGLDEHAVTNGRSNGGVAARISLAALTLPQRDAFGGWDGVDPTSYVVPLSHPDSPSRGVWRKWMRRIAETMNEAQRPFVNQNVKFDARWILACSGVDVARLISWDTRVAAHLIDQVQSTALKEVAPRTFGIPRWDDDMDFSKPGASERADLYLLGEYAARDTYWTWRLAQQQRELLFVITDDGAFPVDAEESRNARLGQVASWVSMPTTASLTLMEQRGFMLDADWTQEKLDEVARAGEEALAKIAARYDLGDEFPPENVTVAATSKWFLAWMNAGLEAGELKVTATTPNGNPKWDRHVLRKQAMQGSEAAQLILDARAATKQAEFLRSWMEKRSPKGALHANYNVGSVATGRLSSSSPNMQQVTKSLRPAFIPRPGFVIADIDYSQIELRVAAFLSRSEPMMQAFRRGDDLHKIIAMNTVNAERERRGMALIGLDDITADQRQAGKAANFGLLYDQSPYGFMMYADAVYGVSLSEDEAEALHAQFFDTWAGLREWHDKCRTDARRLGYSASPLGRFRLLPNIDHPVSQLREEAERQAINSPVQGFASDLMQMATASIQGVLYGTTPVRGAYPVATVHDSIVIEVPENGWEAVVAECQERMRDLSAPLQRMHVDFDLPLVAEATVGTRWGLDDVGEM